MLNADFLPLLAQSLILEELSLSVINAYVCSIKHLFDQKKKKNQLLDKVWKPVSYDI